MPAAIVLNTNIGTILYAGDPDSSDSGTPLPSLLTQQGVDKIPHVWLNGEFRTQLFTQVESEATESPQDSVENDVSDPGPVSTDSEWEVLMWFDSEAAAWVSGVAETVDYFG